MTDQNEKGQTPTRPQGLSEVLASIRPQADAELGAEMSKLIEAVVATGKAGSLTYRARVRTPPPDAGRVRSDPLRSWTGEHIMGYISMAAEVVSEIDRSIAKHGDQRHVPLGMGPDTYPLYLGSRVDPQTKASTLSLLATLATDSRSFSQGDGSVTWRDILTEEVFEAYAEADPAAVRAEMIQVAAVAMKIIDKIDADARS